MSNSLMGLVHLEGGKWGNIYHQRPFDGSQRTTEVPLRTSTWECKAGMRRVDLLRQRVSPQGGIRRGVKGRTTPFTQDKE